MSKPKTTEEWKAELSSHLEHIPIVGAHTEAIYRDAIRILYERDASMLLTLAVENRRRKALGELHNFVVAVDEYLKSLASKDPNPVWGQNLERCLLEVSKLMKEG